MLATIEKIVRAVGRGFLNPSVYLRPIAQPISNKPAIASVIHALFMRRNLIRTWSFVCIFLDLCRELRGKSPIFSLEMEKNETYHFRNF